MRELMLFAVCILTAIAVIMGMFNFGASQINRAEHEALVEVRTSIENKESTPTYLTENAKVFKVVDKLYCECNGTIYRMKGE